MNILVAPDSFKGSISAVKLSEILAKEIMESGLTVKIKQVPLADGGEGSLDAISKATNLETIGVNVFDPLFRKVTANYLYNTKKNIAFVELAQASGYHLVSDNTDIMNSSTFGTGQLVVHAIKKGARKVILFIGGSATNDAGFGLLEACGYVFLNKKGEEIRPLPKNLNQIDEIDSSGSILIEYQTKLLIAADVNNPFYGENGAAYIYAKQKGASHNEIEILDEGLKHIAGLIKQKFSVDLQKMKGAGAAGGVGGGLVALAEACIVSGADLIFTLLKLKDEISNADIVLSGEGRIDSQSLNDKLLYKVSQLVKKYHKKLWAICGYFDGGEKLLNEMDIEKIFSLAISKNDMMDSITKPEKYLKRVAQEIITELKTSIIVPGTKI